MVDCPGARYLVAVQVVRFLIPPFEGGWIFTTAPLRKEGAKLPRNDAFTKWELIILRSAALILLVIATIQLIAPEIMKLIRQIIEWFP